MVVSKTSQNIYLVIVEERKIQGSGKHIKAKWWRQLEMLRVWKRRAVIGGGQDCSFQSNVKVDILKWYQILSYEIPNGTSRRKDFLQEGRIHDVNQCFGPVLSCRVDGRCTYQWHANVCFVFQSHKSTTLGKEFAWTPD